MKSALAFFSLSAAAAATRTPQYEWDPLTIKSCVEWYNNGIGETCEYVRKLFSISPDEFTAWNPSVSVDCQPWRFQSYCVVTQEKLDNTSKTKTTTTPMATPTSTSTSTTLGPSPTAWGALGCYVQGNTTSIMEKRMTDESGDASLTVPKCQDMCYRAALRFAGVESGNQCWCSSYVGGEFAPDAAECNQPCSGHVKTICGGKGRLNIFKPLLQAEHTTVSTTTSSQSSSSSVSSASPIASKSKSGASKNLQLF